MYGKLENGDLIEAPKKLPVSDTTVWNPRDEQYRAAGYKPVRFTDAPEAPSGYVYEPGWEEQDEAIVQVWTLAPLPDDIDDAEAFAIIFGGAQ